MAITYRPSFYDTKTQQRVRGDVETTEYEGRVAWVGCREFRAMSDVYTIATYASVVTDDGSAKEIMVNAGFDLDCNGGTAVVDLNDEGRALVEAYRTRMAPIWEAERLACEAVKAAAQKKIDDTTSYRLANQAVTGKKMIVVRGRRVKIGTIGIVAWISANTGGVLLKEESVWKDRKSAGIWVSPEYLEIYDAKVHEKLLNPPVKKVTKKVTRKFQATALYHARKGSYTVFKVYFLPPGMPFGGLFLPWVGVPTDGPEMPSWDDLG